MVLNAPQISQGRFRRKIAATHAQALTHHAVQNQGQHANAGVRLDAIRQAVEHRRNLDLRLQHPKPPLDVRQRVDTGINSQLCGFSSFDQLQVFRRPGYVGTFMCLMNTHNRSITSFIWTHVFSGCTPMAQL